ncbi:MAG: PH domain-containing protein [Polaribacter sp.]|nr:PH domain-containing protein [Polaribacter sp.]MDG1953456.1 PH domain-containing protein [Polaribacter sp.]MDG2073298.1 PH domain-containing protein [Polaribacter sp.]
MLNNSLFADFSRQSPKGIIIIYIKLLYKVLKATWFLLFLFLQKFSKINDDTLIYIYVGIGVLLIFILIRAYLLYKNFLFRIDENHFVLKEGILKKKNTSISFDRIQNVNFKQNLIQQLINVYEVNIETAGSKDTEIAIKALTIDKAEALKKELLQVKSTVEVVEREQLKPLLKINFKELLKVSLTENHLQNLMVFAALVFGVFQQLNDVFKGFNSEDVLDNYTDVNPGDIFNSLFLFVILFLLLIIVGVLSSFVRILLFHFNLTLFIREESFDITQGLLTKKSIILSKGKVQSIIVSTNPIKKKLGISFITFKQAVSGKVKKQQHKLIRIIGCKAEQIKTIKELLYVNDSNESERYVPNKYFIFRMYFRSSIGLLLVNSIILFLIQDPNLLWVNLLFIPLTLLLIQMKYKKAFYQFNEELLIFGEGRVETHLTYLPFFKVQNIKIKQTIFQKRKNVVNLILQTASGKIRIPCIEKERAIKLYNYILYKIESNKESWM